MNKIVLMGRLTADPERRSTAGGTDVARYNLAVDRRFRKDGDPTADFFNCVVFGKGAEFTEKYLRKGTKIVLSGRMESDNYTNKDGQKVYGWRVVVDEQEFAESKSSSESAATNKSNSKPTQNSSKTMGEEFVEVQIDEDLPFI